MATFSTPGITTARETEERQILASKRGNVESMLMDMPVVIKSTAVDAGNTPTTTLRAGLVMGIKTNDGLAYQYDTNGTDGTQNAVGILSTTVSMLDETSIAVDKSGRIYVNGQFRESELLLLDEAAKASLGSIGIKFVAANAYSRIDGSQSLVHQAATEAVGAASPEVITSADNGKLFVCTAVMNFTLPTLAPGLSFEFLQTANANMIITGSTNIVGPNGVGFSTITFSTASKKIGAYVRIRAVHVGTTLKWLPEMLSDITAVPPVFAT